HGKVDVRAKRMRTLIRQCRRRVPELILALCRRWPELDHDQRKAAWRVLLLHLAGEVGQERRQIREQAYVAAAAIPGFRDVRGRSFSLVDVLKASRPQPVDVLVGEQFRKLRLDLPDLDKPILTVDVEEYRCLAAHGELRQLDDDWKQELATIRTLAAAPKAEPPNIHAVALAYRKAMVSGDLECELWVPRDQSPFDDRPPELIFVRAEREVGRGTVSAIVTSAGIVGGSGLVVSGGEVDLDDRQIASLERQMVIMYIELATRFAKDQVDRADRPRVLEYLSWAAQRCDQLEEYVRGHGKHGLNLRYALDRVVPPSMRAAVRREPPAAEPPAAEPPPVEPELKVEPPAEPKPVRPPLANTPEQRLLAAVYE